MSQMASQSKMNILLLGTRSMAREYARVFRDGLGFSFSVVGRNLETLKKFAEDERAAGWFTFAQLNHSTIQQFDFIVVATAAESLESVVKDLLSLDAKKILVEKPGTLTAEESLNLFNLAETKGATVRVAYNRRYYRSVQKLKQILQNEQAVLGTFDFTESMATLQKVDRPEIVKQRWGICNSVHVIDSVSYLLGKFSQLRTEVKNKDQISLHPAGGTFFGNAICNSTPVTYSSSWLCPGRWEIQVMTPQGRYKLSPMERLQVMKQGSYQWEEVPADYAVDTDFKPGLFELVKDFHLTGGRELPDFRQNAALIQDVSAIAGYSLL